MATINLGRVKPIYKGAYNTSMVYMPLDFVTHEGRSYFCILQTTAGITPSNTTYWRFVIDESEFLVLKNATIDARDLTEIYRDAAFSSMETAITKSSEAASSESHALTYKNTAEEAKTLAQTAKSQSESARDLANEHAITATGQAEIATTRAEEASINASHCADSAEEAHQWAEAPKDIPVQPGMYSAMHWAIKAQEFAETTAVAVGYNDGLTQIGKTNVQQAIDYLVLKTTNVDNTADNVKDVLSASKLTTARTIEISGDVIGSVSFDGSENINLTTSVTDDSHNHIVENVDGLQTVLDGLQTDINNRVTIYTLSKFGGEMDYALSLKANLDSPTFTGTVSGITKTMVGLDSVDNTADNEKNVLSATKLTTARTIGGVIFDGSADINLPGVNSEGNQNTTGAAARASKFSATTWVIEEIGGVLYFSVSGVNKAKLDASGNLTVVGNITAYGTI